MTETQALAALRKDRTAIREAFVQIVREDYREVPDLAGEVIGVLDAAMAATPDPLGNDKGPEYAVLARAEALLDEATLSGVFTSAERAMFGVYSRLIASGVRVGDEIEYLRAYNDGYSAAERDAKDAKAGDEIDVERLARALLSGGLWPIYDPSKPNRYRGGPFDLDYRGYAAAIAREYAAPKEAER